MKLEKCKYQRWFYIFLLTLILFLSSIFSIPFKVAIARYQYPQPQAILSLGGFHPREQLAAQLAVLNPQLKIWVSSGSDDEITRQIFNDVGIEPSRYHIDRRATDTVTNFTTLVKDFEHDQIKHLFLITSDFHMSRAKAIAFIVLGSRGIIITPVAIASNVAPEKKLKIIRDIGRSLFWLFTGRTGSSLNGRR